MLDSLAKLRLFELWLKQKTTFVMSNGREKMFEDISATKGTPFVSGMNENSTPTKTKIQNVIKSSTATAL